MAETVETPAIVLDRIPYGEADLILHLLTRDHGLVAALARSARGSRRRFAGGVDLFVIADVRFRPAGARSSLALLAGAEPVRSFPGLYDHLDRMEAGQAMLMLARDLLRDAPAGESTFLRVVEALARLETAPPDRAPLEILGLAIALLCELGHPPVDESCPACGDAVGASGVVVVAPDGAMLCGRCAPAGAVRFASSLLGGTACEVEAGPVPARADVLSLVAALVSGVLGRRWRLRMGTEA